MFFFISYFWPKANELYDARVHTKRTMQKTTCFSSVSGFESRTNGIRKNRKFETKFLNTKSKIDDKLIQSNGKMLHAIQHRNKNRERYIDRAQNEFWCTTSMMNNFFTFFYCSSLAAADTRKERKKFERTIFLRFASMFVEKLNETAADETRFGV